MEKKIAWIAWDLPDMPWDSAYLYSADIKAQKGIYNTKKIAGGKKYICHAASMEPR